MTSELAKIWSYRFFIINSIKSDFRNKFARSRLGALWLILNPLAFVLMYTLVLSSAMSSKINNSGLESSYTAYLLAGMLCWSLLTDIIVKSSTLFVDNANIIKKIVFPKIALPITVAGTGLINNIILFFIVMIGLSFLQSISASAFFWYLPLVFLAIGLAIGLGLILGIINVFLRDIGQIVPLLMQFSFWFTPIAYPSSIIPEQYRYLLQLNPFYYLINSYQRVFAFDQLPDMKQLLIITVIIISILTIAWFFFSRANNEIVDSL